MRPQRRDLFFLAVIAAIVALAIVFPRAQAFLELAAREFRILWWLVILIAVLLYLGSLKNRRRDK